jgi:hypothetical protein
VQAVFNRAIHAYIEQAKRHARKRFAEAAKALSPADKQRVEQIVGEPIPW